MTVRYSQLKRRAILSVTASPDYNNILSTLKDFFKDKINSPRRFEEITTIGQLLEMLEIRDELSEDNVETLKHIAKSVTNSQELLKNISDYEASDMLENENSSASTNTQTSVPERFPTSPTHPYIRNCSSEKIQRICNTIIEEIGSHWRVLARELKISEARIQLFDEVADNCYDKASLMMDFYCNQKADPQRWFFNLCQALEKARRCKLSTSIQEIMTMSL